MTLKGNGTIQKIIVGIVTAVIVLLFTQVLGNTNRVTAVEVDVAAIKGVLKEYRLENRDEHRQINDKLDSISKEIRKRGDTD